MKSMVWKIGINKGNCNGKLEKNVRIGGSSCLWILWGGKCWKMFRWRKKKFAIKVERCCFYFFPAFWPLFGCCWFLATFNFGLEGSVPENWKSNWRRKSINVDKLFTNSANCWPKVLQWRKANSDYCTILFITRMDWKSWKFQSLSIWR